MKWKYLVNLAAAAVLVMGSLAAPGVLAQDETPPGDDDGMTAPEENPEPDEMPEPDMTTGREHAREVISASLERQVEHLTRLLDQVPDQARPGIERAIQAMSQGRENALSALDEGAGEMEELSSEEPTDVESAGGAGGRDKAREAVVRGTRQAVRGLTEAKEQVPTEQRTVLDLAVRQVRRGRDQALQALGGGPPGDRARTDRARVRRAADGRGRHPRPTRVERPDRPPRPDRPVRPDRPPRPDRPQRPDRPSRPPRPEIPQRPDLPPHPGPAAPRL
ncbi:MAG: hypothetical protein ACE5HD_06320 [Acidobacteriota bacterium]